MREIDELTDVDDPAWPVLLQELSDTPVPVEVLPGDAEAGRAGLRQLQISARSNLGAIVLNCGGLLVDSGWLRIFGSPHCADADADADAQADADADADAKGLPGLAEVNAMPSTFDPAWRPEAGLVVAHDVLGGVFALNGADPREAGRPGGPGEVVHFAPDASGWTALGAGHSAWLSWILAGGLDEFYGDLRWDGWPHEVSALTGRQGLSFHPPLWSAEARQNLRAASRRAVPMAELLGLNRDSCRQFDGADPGFLGNA